MPRKMLNGRPGLRVPAGCPWSNAIAAAQTDGQRQAESCSISQACAASLSATQEKATGTSHRRSPHQQLTGPTHGAGPWADPREPIPSRLPRRTKSHPGPAWAPAAPSPSALQLHSAQPLPETGAPLRVTCPGHRLTWQLGFRVGRRRPVRRATSCCDFIAHCTPSNGR